MRRRKHDRRGNVFYKPVSPAPIRMVTISIDRRQILIAAWPINFGQAQNRTRQSWLAEDNPLRQNLLVPILQDILRRRFPPIRKEHGAQRCFFAEQFIVDWTRLDFREASVRPVYISTAQQDEPSRAPSKRCYRGLRILQPHR